MNRILDRIAMTILPDQKRRQMLVRLFSDHASSQKRLYALAGAAMVTVAATTALTAFLMEYIVEAMTTYENRSLILLVAGAVAGTFAVKGLANYVQTVALTRAGNRIVARQQKELYSKLLDHGVSFFLMKESSNLLMRLTNGAQAAQQVIDLIVSSIARDLLMLVGLIGVMIYQEPFLSLFALVIGPIAVMGVRNLVKRVKEIMQSEMNSVAEIIKVVQETSKGIQVVKVFSLEDQMRERLSDAVSNVERRRNAIARIGAITSPLMETLSGLAIAAVVAVSAFSMFGREATTPGQLMSFITAFMMAYEPAKRLSRVRIKLEQAMVRVRMMFELLDYEELLIEAPDAKPLSVGAGEVRFENVSFGYNENKYVLKNLDIAFEARKMSALVGPSGGGKSTILNLVMRLYDPQEGRVLINGHDAKGATFESLRNKISFVGQDTFLFSTTVRENIRFGRSDASDEEVEDAARAANAHEFIEALAEGYDTEVGENGIFLSGGQRQRLAIARAILRRSEVLLLDEATSSLDANSENIVKEALARLTHGVTTIVIAHRLSTILEADRVFVISDGAVSESGNVQDLLHTNGHFRELFDRQFEGLGDAADDL